jgi:hypothetical protein
MPTSRPVKARPTHIECFFDVDDPVNGMYVLDGEGNWHLVPLVGDVGGRWGPLFKEAHLLEREIRPSPGGGNEPEGYLIKDWESEHSSTRRKLTCERSNCLQVRRAR